MIHSSPCGLVATIEDAAQQVPLTAVDVRVRIVGPTSRVTVRQRYENRESVPVEATYLFPLEEGSAVCGFAVTLDGHRLLGRVDQRDAAFDQYDDAMSDGHAAFLLDQERPNLFTASVGNLLPGQVAEVEITFVSALPRAGEGFRLALPSAITPRYHGAIDSAERMDDVERITPVPTEGALGYTWNLVVEADLLGPIARLSSPTHRIVTSFAGDAARIELAADDRRPDRDFVLELVPRDPLAARGVLVSGPDGHRYGLVDVRGDLPRERRPVEVIFVVDCSGSMSGDSIANARRTLLLSLRSLHPGDRFDVVRFGSTYLRCFGQPLEYDDRTLERATRWVEHIDADLGGTEILAPLTELLQAPADPDGRARNVVVITDGAVSNEDEVLALGARHASTTRIFAIGVGPAASEHLVRGLARVSNGAAEFVTSGEEIADKVLRHVARIGSAFVRTLSIDSGEPANAASMPTIDGIQPTTLYFRVDEGFDFDAMTLRGLLGDQQWTQVVTLTAVDVDDCAIPTLWARERIRALEDEKAVGPRGGSRQEARHRSRERNVHKRVDDELVAIGRQFGLLSSATSYVIVDDRPDVEKAVRPAQLRRVPTATVLQSGVMRLFTPLPPLAGMIDRAYKAGFAMDVIVESSAPATVEPVPIDDPLLHQSADGSWPLTSWSAEFTGFDADRLRALGLDPDDEAVARVAVTALVLAEIHRRGQVPASWEPALEKARQWLARAAALVPQRNQGWLEWAEAVLQAERQLG